MNWLRIVLVLSTLLLPIAAPAADDAPRNFVIRFDILNYDGSVDDAVRFIFSDLLRSGDQLIVYSPARVYGFSKTTLTKPRSELIAFLQKNLRDDTSKAGRSYELVIRDMKGYVRTLENVILGMAASPQEAEVDLKNSIGSYRNQLENLQQLRRINEPLLQQLVGIFRNQPGSNHLVIFYEKELRPVPKRQVMDKLRDMPKISFQALELFAQDNTKAPFDAAAFAAQCAQMPVKVHFFYVKPKNEDTLSEGMFEQSGDIFNAFSSVAKATGGLRSTVGEPRAALVELDKVARGVVSVDWQQKSETPQLP